MAHMHIFKQIMQTYKIKINRPSFFSKDILICLVILYEYNSFEINENENKISFFLIY